MACTEVTESGGFAAGRLDIGMVWGAAGFGVLPVGLVEAAVAVLLAGIT